MRKIYILLMMLLSFGFANAQSEVSQDILQAFSENAPAVITANLNDNVELVINNYNDVYSRQQSTVIINDFFRKNRVSSFQIMHTGNKESAAFAICTMKAGKESYRVYILTRKSGSRQYIQQLRIEPSYE